MDFHTSLKTQALSESRHHENPNIGQMIKACFSWIFKHHCKSYVFHSILRLCKNVGLKAMKLQQVS